MTLERIGAGSLGFSELQVDGSAILWLEQRATERGRRALVRWTPEAGAHDVLPTDADVGTRVHEYGGGAYVAARGLIVYSERADDGVWLVEPSGERRPLVTVPGCRYAAFALDEGRRLVYAVREDHRDRPPTAPANAIVALALDPPDPAANAGEVVFGASDFVLAPQLSFAGERLAFVAWDQPHMPWDETRLVVAELDAAGRPHDLRVVAGGPGESIVAAEWSPEGDLIFASDRTDWWNCYAWRDGTTEALAPVEAEIGEPPWVFGRRSFVPLREGRVLCAVIRDGERTAAVIAGGSLASLPYGAVDASPLPYGAGAAYIARPADAPASVRLAATLADGASVPLRVASDDALDPLDISPARDFVVPTSDGETTHVTYYPPRNAQVAPPGGAPPLIVMSHGGPTSMHVSTYDLTRAFWTTRGFAVAQVNYRGSSGFGRAYRTRLDGAWGEADVIDCISAARWLAAEGYADPARIAIRGASASGMTSLLAVATSDAFAATTSLYGVMDLTALAAETHKFEARYTDALVGPLPEAAATYRARSPINHTATIDVPVLLLQGLEDRVVPPDQATSMRDALLARGVRVIYEAFEGEGHGFRRAATVRRALERELDFYRDVFGRS